MTFAKISAWTGYLYLIRHTALGDAEPAGERDAASYCPGHHGTMPLRLTLLLACRRAARSPAMDMIPGCGHDPENFCPL
jgi:hypothetical protein